MENNRFFNYKCNEIVADTMNGIKTIVSGISFSIEKGKSLALTGRTGSGKTMTALSVMGLLPENVLVKDALIELDGKTLLSTKISDDGKPADACNLLGKEIVYIPQNGLESLNPSITVKSQLFDSLKLAGIGKKERMNVALQKLKQAGFDKPAEILNKYPFQLSGGMAQRVCIAIAACSDAKLLIADEPTNGLDDVNKLMFVNLLANVFPDTAKLIITHDPKLASLCDDIYEIK